MEENSVWASKKKKTEFSVYLSGLLRHRPEELGLDMDEGGWVDVEQLLAKINEQGRWHLTLEQLEEVVDTDEKGRYRIRRYIKACQGHSIPWVKPELTPAEPPEVLFHGTHNDALKEILISGAILPMKRHAVHLQAEEEPAWKSARRWHGKNPVVVRIDAAQMARDGIAFGVSENGVWCCDRVPVEYIIGVIRMSEAERLALATWNEKNRKKYLAELKHGGKKPVSRKLFYIDPVGTAAQNDMLVALVINYIACNVKTDYLVETILSWKKPFFHVEGMSETEPGSGEFQPMRVDLIEQILKKEDAPLLRRLYDHIDLDLYPEHREGIERLMKK